MEMSNETKERLLTVFTEMEDGLKEVHNLSKELDLDKVELHIEDAKGYADDAESCADKANDAASDAHDAIEDINETIRTLQEAIADIQIHAKTVMDIVRPFLPKSDFEKVMEFVKSNRSTLKGLYLDNYTGEGRTNGTAAAINSLAELLNTQIDLNEMALSSEQIEEVVNQILG